DVPLHGRVIDHGLVGDRDENHRHIGGEDQCRDQLVGDAVCNLAEEVDGGRKDDDQLDIAPEFDMRDVDAAAAIIHLDKDAVSAGHFQRIRRHHLGGGRGQHNLDVVGDVTQQMQDDPWQAVANV